MWGHRDSCTAGESVDPHSSSDRPDSLKQIKDVHTIFICQKHDHTSPLGDTDKGAHCGIARGSGELEETAVSPWGHE